MNLKELIETTDHTIGPGLWMFRGGPAKGTVYEVLGMADYAADDRTPEVACVVRGRSPVALISEHGLFKQLYFIGPEDQGGGEPRAWMVEGWESFIARFEPITVVGGGRAMDFIEQLRSKSWSVFRLP